MEFSKELNYKDQLYVDSLKKFRADIEYMISLMRKQFHDLRSQMLDHIKKIEDKFNEDRNKLIENYKKNIENLIQQLKEEETKGSSQLSKLEDAKEDESDKSAYKKEMEMINKIYVMEKHFNFLKENIEVFTYDLKILNEKLDYRVEVRSEKIKENEEKDRQYTKWSTTRRASSTANSFIGGIRTERLVEGNIAGANPSRANSRPSAWSDLFRAVFGAVLLIGVRLCGIRGGLWKDWA